MNPINLNCFVFSTVKSYLLSKYVTLHSEKDQGHRKIPFALFSIPNKGEKYYFVIPTIC